MADTVVDSVPLADLFVGGHSLSVAQLFLDADIVVKTVLILLVVASVWCWAIIFEKVWRLYRLNRSARAFEDAFWSGRSLDELYDDLGKRPRDPMVATFAAGMREWRHAANRGLTANAAVRSSLQDRIQRVMMVTVSREMARLEHNMTFLASVGSTAPFVGLFGTVWGIMNSFAAIAESQNTSLVVVAPGIAEALFATALGLLAAIPAVLAYNKFAADLGRYAERLEAFTEDFAAILSRHLEERV